MIQNVNPERSTPVLYGPLLERKKNGLCKSRGTCSSYNKCMFSFRSSLMYRTALPPLSLKFFSHHWGAGSTGCSGIQVMFRMTVMFIRSHQELVMPGLVVRILAP
jgi:hypothetical protein